MVIHLQEDTRDSTISLHTSADRFYILGLFIHTSETLLGKTYI